MHPSASPALTWLFAALACAMCVAVVGAVHRVRPAWTVSAAAVAALWLMITAAAALSGWTADLDARPPPLAFVVVATLGAGAALGVSRVGTALATLPLCVLVGFQGFRVPLELLMHRAASEGVMPSLLSYSGRNVDIVAGAGALVVGIALRLGAPRVLAWGWVVVASATLANVVVLSVLASPMFLLFGEAQRNTWIAFAPFIWLPTVFVTVALAGQIVLVRALWAARQRRPQS